MTSMHTPIKTRAKARVAPASRASNPGRDKAPPKASTRPRAEPAPKDAIAMLRADHDAVSRLFAEHDRTRSRADRQALVAEICRSLSVHAQIEEEIFYPAVRAALKDATLLPEATVEHDGMKALIAQM